MRGKRGVLATVVVIALLCCLCLVTGCKKKDADIVGTWVLYYDWFCSGSPAMTYWYILGNGSFTTGDGFNGTWDVDKDEVTLTYASGTTYTGTADGDSMDGTMVAGGGGTGCWVAQRIAKSKVTAPVIVNGGSSNQP